MFGHNAICVTPICSLIDIAVSKKKRGGWYQPVYVKRPNKEINQTVKIALNQIIDVIEELPGTQEVIEIVETIESIEQRALNAQKERDNTSRRILKTNILLTELEELKKQVHTINRIPRKDSPEEEQAVINAAMRLFFRG